ncbi:hypothetical protein [Nostoc sp. FACHB-152]|uniref:hypothetical protein n=1 Tax=Nostoc sp. FACHB-152 TaxID=2692837 RepID=UPI001F55206F|nr:hypothetical protein [Nostoc sp. FACHB-152]
MKISKFYLSLAGAIAILSSAAYYYVFILGAPQLDLKGLQKGLECRQNKSHSSLTLLVERTLIRT